MSGYLGRKVRPTVTPPERPNRESLVDFHARLARQAGLDAGGEYSLAEKNQARYIKFCMANGTWTAGSCMTPRMRALVYADGAPAGDPYAQELAASEATRHGIARQIDASLGTDPVPHAPGSRRALGTDHAQHTRSQMSYGLQRVSDECRLNGMEPPWPEAAMDHAMEHLGMTDTSLRLQMKCEADALQMLDRSFQSEQSYRQHQAGGGNRPYAPRAIENPDPPKPVVRKLEGRAADGGPAHDGTAFWCAGTGLENLE